MDFNIIDIIIAVVLVAFTLAGLRKGLVGNLVGFISLIASIILARILYPVVADLLMSFGVRDYIYGLVIERVNISPDGGMMIEILPELIRESVKNGADTAIMQITSYITDIILNIVSFLIVLIISRVIIFIVEKTLKIAVKLPVLNGLNKIGGLAVGLLKGIIFVYIISMLIMVISPVMMKNEAVQSSFFMKTMHNRNPVVNSIIEEQLEIEQNGE